MIIRTLSLVTLLAMVACSHFPKSHYEGSREMTTIFKEMMKCGEDDPKKTDCDGKYKGKVFVAEALEIDDKGDLIAIKANVASSHRWFMCFALARTQKEKIAAIQTGQIIKFKGIPGDVATRGPYSVIAIDYCEIEDGAPPAKPAAVK